MAFSEIRKRERIEIRAKDNCNLPNALTLARIILAPVIILLLQDDNRFKNYMAALTVGTAAFTDFLDGYVARKQGKETPLGQFLDPLADKICVSTAFIMLSMRRRLPGWVPGIIIGREMLVTLFRVYAGARGSTMPSSIWGKLKTNSQLLALLLVIMDYDNPAYKNLQKIAVNLAVVLTVYSGLDYILKASSSLTSSEGD